MLAMHAIGEEEVKRSTRALDASRKIAQHEVHVKLGSLSRRITQLTASALPRS